MVFPFELATASCSRPQMTTSTTNGQNFDWLIDGYKSGSLNFAKREPKRNETEPTVVCETKGDRQIETKHNENETNQE